MRFWPGAHSELGGVKWREVLVLDHVFFVKQIEFYRFHFLGRLNVTESHICFCKEQCHAGELDAEAMIESPQSLAD